MSDYLVSKALRVYVSAVEAALRAGVRQGTLAEKFGVTQSYFSKALKAARDAPAPEYEQLPLPFELPPLAAARQVSSPKPTPAAQGAKAPAPQGQENPLSTNPTQQKKPPPPGGKTDSDALRKMDIGFDPDEI